MINKFHILSRKTLLCDVVGLPERSKMVSVRTMAYKFRRFTRQSREEQRAEQLIRVYESRQLIKDRPDNLWLVYELCKDIYELAEIDHVDFNGASLKTKLKLIYKVASFADLEALNDGVTEYHESRVRENWKMNFLTGEGEAHAEITTH